MQPVINPGDSLNLDDLLESVPVRNRSVRSQSRGERETVVFVPIRRQWYMGPPLSWFMPLSKDRAVALDGIGREVWDGCDGVNTVERIVENFSSSHHVSFHQARLSVMEFLRLLTRRGMIAVVGPHRKESQP